jgi:DNA invertase Pin-like site-specific DNA recombinase
MARKDLEAWRRMYDQRDERVILAHKSGVGVNEIARLTGLAKTTVLRILAGQS